MFYYITAHKTDYSVVIKTYTFDHTIDGNEGYSYVYTENTYDSAGNKSTKKTIFFERLEQNNTFATTIEGALEKYLLRRKQIALQTIKVFKGMMQ